MPVAHQISLMGIADAFVVCLKRADHTAGSGAMRGIEVAAPSTSVERAA